MHGQSKHARCWERFFFVAYVGSVVALAAFGLFGMLQLQLAAALLPGSSLVCASRHSSRGS